ncbi:ribosome maturation factor RimM [Striga asiatica]|uniref:Ribosome maturation factor RimM n=1 Tax=Striga asiatica TaxID=4170 RepID=A0A5A7PE79_STRAF|nr:ribosome maturation factor RimM [Striga asiatica]
MFKPKHFGISELNLSKSSEAELMLGHQVEKPQKCYSDEDSVQYHWYLELLCKLSLFPLFFFLFFQLIGVVSGKAIFGPPLDEYWKKKLQEETAAKENNSTSPTSH